MSFVVLPEMRRAYRDSGNLELEEFLSPNQLISLNDGINAALSESKGDLNFSKKYLLGRDLWRRQELVRQITLKKKHASFAKEMLQQYEMMIGFDQLFDYSSVEKECVPPEAPATSTIQEIFFVSPITTCLMIQVSGKEGTEGLFPKKPGNGTWIDPNLSIDWEKEKREGARFLLVGYARNPSKFKDIPNDPHCPLLKRMDYQANSPLKQLTHPFL